MTVRRHGRRLKGLTVLAAVSLIGATWAGPAAAWTGVVEWPTFFRTGPGRHFVVLQELARGMTVDVQSCADKWCMIQVGRVTGYLEQANLGQQPPPSLFPAPAANATGCFDSRRDGFHGGETYRYCPR